MFNVPLPDFEERVAYERGEGEEEEDRASGAGEGWGGGVVWDVGHCEVRGGVRTFSSNEGGSGCGCRVRV